MLLFLIYEITERRAVTRQKRATTLTPSGRLKNIFSGRQLGLVQEETLVVFYTGMPRETVRTTWDEVERREKSHPEQESSSVPKVKTQTDVKSLTSLKASLATKAENPLSMVGKMKKIVL